MLLVRSEKNVKFLFFKIFVGVQLIYNLMLVSAVQPSESVIHINILTLLLDSFSI